MKNLILVILMFAAIGVCSQTLKDSIVTHRTVFDKDGKLLPWYKPNEVGAAYDHVIDLATGFLKVCPIEPTTNLPLYMVHTWFASPEMVGQQAFDKGLSGSEDGFTPACTFANFVQSLAVKYYAYTGDKEYIKLVQRCLDHLIEHGTTPLDSDWVWAGVPYASANPRSVEYFGATHWGVGGRNDGPFVIEPDKVGEMGIEYLNFYKIVPEQKYLNAAINCADALVKNYREVYDGSNWEYIYEDHDIQSPWPFRVSAENGQVHEEYTANIVGAVKLFDELVRLKERLGIPDEKVIGYRKTREAAWKWLYSKEGPMRTSIWKGYFEDIPNDKHNKNRVNNIPMETARYILENPEYDPNHELHIPALIYWVATTFETQGMDAIKEQFWCYEPMGSHTARYASICAMWYEKTGDEWYKEQAFRFFNWATFVCDKNGHVIVGPGFYQYWFTDGYGDYIRHFIDGMAAVPEWAPIDENHLLKSTSVIQEIEYQDELIRFKTYDDSAKVIMRLVSKPKIITVNGIELSEGKMLNNNWTWKGLGKGGVLQIQYFGGNEILVKK